MNYIEMPLKLACEHFPMLEEICCANCIDKNDDDYIVRISDDMRIEVGYKSDAWIIKDNPQ